MSASEKYRITQTLLGNWLYTYKVDDGYEKFLKCLRREKEPPTKAMLDGIRFEGCVNSVLDGAPISPDHEWYKPVTQLARYLDGAQQQVTLFREIKVDGIHFLLHGVLDFLKEGIIYDTKFSKNYHLNKYLLSPQHPMYFALEPDAYEFQYLSCDGTYVYRETYRPEDVTPIDVTIKQFMQFLDRQNLVDTYCELWKTKG